MNTNTPAIELDRHVTLPFVLARQTSFIKKEGTERNREKKRRRREAQDRIAMLMLVFRIKFMETSATKNELTCIWSNFSSGNSVASLPRIRDTTSNKSSRALLTTASGLCSIWLPMQSQSRPHSPSNVMQGPMAGPVGELGSMHV